MTQLPDNRHSDIPRSSCSFIFFCCLSGTCFLSCSLSACFLFFFHTFCTCQVGHLFSSILTSHISNFSSKFWSCRWQTLHYDSQQTRTFISQLFIIPRLCFQNPNYYTIFRPCRKYFLPFHSIFVSTEVSSEKS